MRDLGRAGHASTEQLSALLDGRSEPEDEQFVAGHVPACVGCSRLLGELRSVRDLLRALPVHLPPRSFTIPVAEAAPSPRRFQRLIPITQALSAVAAILCVVLFSVDAIQLASDDVRSVSDGAGAMQITTRATIPSEAPPAAPAPAAQPAAARQPAEPAKPAEPETAAKISEAPAVERAAKPAAALPPAKPADTAARAPAATPPASGAAAQAPAAPKAPAPAQPAAAPQAPAPAPAATAAGTTASQARPTAPAASGPAPATAAQPTTVASPWLSPIRLWSLGFAILAAVLLLGSVVLSRYSRRRSAAQDEWSRS